MTGLQDPKQDTDINPETAHEKRVKSPLDLSVEKMVSNHFKRNNGLLEVGSGSLNGLINPKAEDHKYYRKFENAKREILIPWENLLGRQGNEFNRKFATLLSGKDRLEVGSPLHLQYLALLSECDHAIREEYAQISDKTNEKYKDLTEEQKEKQQGLLEDKHSQIKWQIFCMAISVMCPIGFAPFLADIMDPLLRSGDLAGFISQMTSTKGPLGVLAAPLEFFKIPEVIDTVMRVLPSQEIGEALLGPESPFNVIGQLSSKFAGGPLGIAVIGPALMLPWLVGNHIETTDKQKKELKSGTKGIEKLREAQTKQMDGAVKKQIENFSTKYQGLLEKSAHIMDIDEYLRSPQGQSEAKELISKDKTLEKFLEEPYSHKTGKACPKSAEHIGKLFESNKDFIDQIYEMRGRSRWQSKAGQETDSKIAALYKESGFEPPITAEANQLLLNHPDYFRSLKDDNNLELISPLDLAIVMAKQNKENRTGFEGAQSSFQAKIEGISNNKEAQKGLKDSVRKIRKSEKLRGKISEEQIKRSNSREFQYMETDARRLRSVDAKTLKEKEGKSDTEEQEAYYNKDSITCTLEEAEKHKGKNITISTKALTHKNVEKILKTVNQEGFGCDILKLHVNSMSKDMQQVLRKNISGATNLTTLDITPQNKLGLSDFVQNFQGEVSLKINTSELNLSDDEITSLSHYAQNKAITFSSNASLPNKTPNPEFELKSGHPIPGGNISRFNHEAVPAH